MCALCRAHSGACSRAGWGRQPGSQGVVGPTGCLLSVGSGTSACAWHAPRTRSTHAPKPRPWEAGPTQQRPSGWTLLRPPGLLRCPPFQPDLLLRKNALTPRFNQSLCPPSPTVAAAHERHTTHVRNLRPPPPPCCCSSRAGRRCRTAAGRAAPWKRPRAHTLPEPSLASPCRSSSSSASLSLRAPLGPRPAARARAPRAQAGCAHGTRNGLPGLSPPKPVRPRLKPWPSSRSWPA